MNDIGPRRPVDKVSRPATIQPVAAQPTEVPAPASQPSMPVVPVATAPMPTVTKVPRPKKKGRVWKVILWTLVTLLILAGIGLALVVLYLRYYT